ncbi:NAD(P)H-dependent oxidoreductase [Companilactobacillus halodurans]|uniref:Flavodoxin family protein n=1 Tax=Companilactobacillus halodurans TaxID=2584183 RepID=A0A5P0ZWP6_9LACO|nr:NAD(P)H-dependent oxidoreductase [Companilactobacillus halodurans]MQS75380.1 flavodoxin family protein [Companilactobacillus halodurans]MQS97325.1 flavodoxin family protein [Companilactobacillus halodurans]
MKTIIYTHPYPGSFNHEILNRLSWYFSRNDEEYEIIDPYFDNFNPNLSEADLLSYSQGKTEDVLVKNYQRRIAASDELIFIFPIWWQTMPAMLKGFLDKTMLSGFAYDESNGWKGLLTNIKKVTVITTSTVTKEYLEKECGDPIQGVFIDRTLDDLGINPQNVNWVHFGRVNVTTDEARQEFLEKVPQYYLNK